MLLLFVSQSCHYHYTSVLYLLLNDICIFCFSILNMSFHCIWLVFMKIKCQLSFISLFFQMSSAIFSGFFHIFNLSWLSVICCGVIRCLLIDYVCSGLEFFDLCAFITLGKITKISSNIFSDPYLPIIHTLCRRANFDTPKCVSLTYGSF